MRQFLQGAVSLYVDGFRGMRTGRTLWKIVLLKLFVLFVVLKPLFFPNFLQTSFDTDAERADHVLTRLTNSGAEHTGEKHGTLAGSAAVRQWAAGHRQAAQEEPISLRR